MSKEQKTFKSCYILDRLREWFELYGNQNHQKAEEELHLAIDELYEYQQKDRQLADLEAKLAERDKVILILEKQNKALSEEEDLLTEKLKELGVDCIEDLGKLQNQKAIELLEKVKAQCEFDISFACDEQEQRLYDFIDEQIELLKRH